MIRRYHPVFLDLEGRACVVVGAGRIARAKAESLLEAGADVTVVAPEIGRELADHAAARRLKVVEREFRDSDLAGAFLVIAATDDVEVNRKVHAEAQRRRLLTCVVDTLPLCNFIISRRHRGPARR